MDSVEPPIMGEKWVKSAGSIVKSIAASAGAKELCGKTV